METGKIIQTDMEQTHFSPVLEAQETATLLLAIIKSVNLQKQTLPDYFKVFLETLESVWHFPSAFNMKIVYKNTEVMSNGFRKPAKTIREELFIRNRKVGYIEAGIIRMSLPEPDVFREEKIRAILKTIIPVLVNAVEQIKTAAAIRRLSSKLREKKTELEKKNLALKEILNQIEKEKTDLRNRIKAHIKKLILPVLTRLKSNALSEETRRHYLEILESNFLEIASDFTDKSINDKVNLSPRELEICNLITNGYHSKEIAQLLQISVLTVERHRFNIRRKMGIRKHQVNLRSFLQNS